MALMEAPHALATERPDWSPYADNGGTTVAIAGEDFAIIASDNRLSAGYSIYTRDQPKLFNLSDATVLGTTGCWCDILTFTRVLDARITMYRHEHNRKLSTPAAAQLLSIMLYQKRFFPYYISNVLAGLDVDGKGCVYSYDPVGHFDSCDYRAGGSASALIQPVLDNQIGQKNQEGVVPKKPTIDEALKVIKDAFISATERDIYTGDGVSIKIITKDGIKDEFMPLRRD